MSEISVFSEIMPLKKVMVHRPGKELLNLSPETLERLSYDDMPYLADAETEHDQFVEIMRNEGAEVVYLKDLAAQTLAQSDDIRTQFIDQYIAEGGLTSKFFIEAVREYLTAIADPYELVEKTLAGIRIDELDLPGSSAKNNLATLSGDPHRMIVEAMAASFFTRDPFACVGNGVTIHSMHSNTRFRETLYGDYIFRYHQDYKNTKRYFERDCPASIEGGDVLVLNEHVLAVGVSLRTGADAVQTLATKLFEDDSPFDTVLAFQIPASWAFMHLDTVFTQVDHGTFTVHPGILGPLKVYELAKQGASISISEIEDTLGNILKRYLDIDNIDLLQCGGGDRITAGREQFYDGTNTLCIAPGVVIVYWRNNVTNDLLRESGLRVLELRGAELSRGRGGPRCMTMPFVREK